MSYKDPEEVLNFDSWEALGRRDQRDLKRTTMPIARGMRSAST